MFSILTRALRAAPALALAVFAVGCAAAAGDDAASQSGALDEAPRARGRLARVECTALVVPQCDRLRPAIDGPGACGEGHDRLYTAYVLSSDGAGGQVATPAIHLECPQPASVLDPCPEPPQRVPLAFEFDVGPFCPGDPPRPSTAEAFTIADDDGCQKACAEGDMVCCSLLAVSPFASTKSSWTVATTVTLKVSCDYDGCEDATVFTNRGTGSNQAAGVTCAVVRQAYEERPDRCAAR